MGLFRHLLPRLHAATSRRLLSSSANCPEAYTNVLRQHRPSTIQYGLQHNFRNRNSISLIGAISHPLEKANTKNEAFVVHTHLRVAGGVFGHFRVFVKFWDQIGEKAAKHLKPNDLVWVDGRLNSYMGEDGNGNHIRHFSVNVSEFCFIAKHCRPASLQNLVKLEPEASAEKISEMCRNRLHLWQLLFRSPHEWWDNRNSKKHGLEPDFKHKNTGEALWIKGNDPPWVKKQLELQDSRLGGSYGQNNDGLSSLTFFDF